jgi:hypothetical protein
MNILLIGADQNNPTDGVIVKGIKNLLSKAFKTHTHDYLFLNDHKPMENNELYLNNKYDILIVCGTPWLWDSFQESQKYKNLLNIFELHKDSKKLFMGIGTCMNLGDINSKILRRTREIEGMHKLFGRHKIITRDHLANELLINANIENELLPCPAYFAYDNNEKTSRFNNIMIWCDPQKTISKDDWKDKNKLNEYYNQYLEFYKKYKPEVYCAFSEEILKAVEIGLPEPKVLKSWEETLEIMKNADKVISGRVHCAVPAISRNADVKLTALDTRSYVVEDFRYNLNLEETEREYIRILNEI